MREAMASTMIVIACPICMQKIRAPETVIGRQVKCPQCKNSFLAADPNSIVADVPEGPARMEGVDPSDWEAAIPTAQPELTSGRSGGSFVDYLVFRRMVTPVIIVIMFYLGAALILLAGLVYGIISLIALLGSRGTALMGLLGLLVAALSTIVGLVMWRVFCEVLISVFRILDNVREINLQMNTKDPI
jgi:Domain of unknown function (DUF4282)